MRRRVFILVKVKFIAVQDGPRVLVVPVRGEADDRATEFLRQHLKCFHKFIVNLEAVHVVVIYLQAECLDALIKLLSLFLVVRLLQLGLGSIVCHQGGPYPERVKLGAFTRRLRRRLSLVVPLRCLPRNRLEAFAGAQTLPGFSLSFDSLWTCSVIKLLSAVF